MKTMFGQLKNVNQRINLETIKNQQQSILLYCNSNKQFEALKNNIYFEVTPIKTIVYLGTLKLGHIDKEHNKYFTDSKVKNFELTYKYTPNELIVSIHYKMEVLDK